MRDRKGSSQKINHKGCILVHVRTVVAATCIKIKSQVAQRNEDLIACSHVSSNHLKRKTAYTGRAVEMFIHDIRI